MQQLAYYFDMIKQNVIYVTNVGLHNLFHPIIDSNSQLFDNITL